MKKQELYHMLQRLFTKEPIPPETVIDINNTFLAQTPNTRAELEEKLKSFMKSYIRTNSQFAILPTDVLQYIEPTTTMEQLLAKQESIMKTVIEDPDQEETENDIVRLMNRVYIIGYQEELNFLNAKMKELKPMITNNKSLQRLLAFKKLMLETHKKKAEVSEQQHNTIYKQHNLRFQYDHKAISEQEYLDYLKQEQAYMDYLDTIVEFTDYNLNYAFYHLSNQNEYELLGANINPNCILHERELKLHAEWLRQEVAITYANWQFLSHNLPEEERREVIGASLLEQAMIETSQHNEGSKKQKLPKRNI